MRKNITSGAPWESEVGYCRAVRIGNVIEVSGTTAIKEGKVQFIGDPYQQTICILEIIETALKEAGATMQDVVRTRMFVTRIEDFKEIGRAHGLYFSEIKPASTLVEVSGLVDKEMLVEIEAVAVIQD